MGLESKVGKVRMVSKVCDPLTYNTYFTFLTYLTFITPSNRRPLKSPTLLSSFLLFFELPLLRASILA